MCSIVQPRAGTGQPSSPTSSGGVCSLIPEHICERLVPAPPHWNQPDSPVNLLCQVSPYWHRGGSRFFRGITGDGQGLFRAPPRSVPFPGVRVGPESWPLWVTPAGGGSMVCPRSSACEPVPG